MPRLRLVLLTLILAAIVHVAVMWLAPYLFLALASARMQDQGLALNNMAFPARVTSESRNVVRPSPDLLYSICLFDLENGPVRITTAEMPSTYWSVSGFAANTDNFFVLSDREAAGKPAHIVLTTDPDYEAGGTLVVQSPSVRGIVLVRMVIIGDKALPQLEAYRRNTTCAPVDV